MSPSDPLAPLRHLVARVGRRQRLADAVWQLRRSAFPLGLWLLALATAGTRFWNTPPAFALVALVPVLAVIAWAVLRPRDWRVDARRLDAHYELSDRIGNALEFAQAPAPADPQQAAWVHLCIDDARQLGTQFDPAPVVPISLPKAGRNDALAVAALLVAALVPVPQPPAPVTTEPATAAPIGELARSEPTVLPFAEPLRRDLRELARGQESTANLANSILDVLAELERGDIDRARALELLDALDELLREAEDEFEATVDEDPALLAEALRQVSEELSQHEVSEQAGEALARQDAEDLEKRLEEAFDQADADAQAAKDMDRALQAAERRLGQAQDQANQTQSKVAEAERRLRREEQQKTEDPEAQERRLRRQRERLDELRRQHEREQAAARELERLRRLARESQSQRNNRSGQGGDKQRSQRQQSRQDLGKQMGDAANKARKARRLSASRDALEEAKSLVRRAGNKGDQRKRRDSQRESFARAAKGKKNKKGEPSMLIEGDVGEPEGDGSMMMEQPGDGSETMPGDQGSEGDAQGDMPSDSPGDGIGEGSDDRLGDESKHDVKAKDHHMAPQQGRGATRAEVIADASQEGFATEAYRRVYTDYRSFAQSSMDDETLPAAQRRQVRRYFQMIQPRDDKP